MKKIILFIILLNTQSHIVYAHHYTSFTKNTLKDKKIVIIGSYKKCFNEMVEALEYFNKNGAQVLAPIKSKVIDTEVDFPILKDDDPKKTKKELQDHVLNMITKADFIYVLNNRYCKNRNDKIIDLGEYWIGLSTSLEMGFAIASKKKIYCIGEPSTLNHKFYCEYLGKDLKNL